MEEDVSDDDDIDTDLPGKNPAGKKYGRSMGVVKSSDLKKSYDLIDKARAMIKGETNQADIQTPDGRGGKTRRSMGSVKSSKDWVAVARTNVRQGGESKTEGDITDMKRDGRISRSMGSVKKSDLKTVQTKDESKASEGQEQADMAGTKGGATSHSKRVPQKLKRSLGAVKVHYTLYTIYYTLYTIHYTLYTIHYTLYPPTRHSSCNGTLKIFH